MNQSTHGQMTIKTPIGQLTVSASAIGITAITIGKSEKRKTNKIENALASRHLQMAQAQLEQYFAGTRPVFELPLDLKGTPFQKKVWEALTKIPLGKTKSYKELAQMIKNPKATRAVGSANGKNPICIVIPCHRVIAHDGGIGGYSGGLKIKTWLLQHEAHKSSDIPKMLISGQEKNENNNKSLNILGT